MSYLDYLYMKKLKLERVSDMCQITQLNSIEIMTRI